VSEWDTKIIGELFGSVPTEEHEFTSDRDDSSLEALVGIKTDVSPNVAFHAGGGTEVIHGTSSPDWRIYTGINWVIGPIFSRPKDVFVKVEDQPLKSLEDLDPADPFEGAPQMSEAFIARDVLFEFNSDQLHPDAHEALAKLVAYLQKPPGFDSLAIEGHTDSVGSALYNLDLSQRRSDRVRMTLIKLGLPAEKIRAMGFGESRPIANNGNYQGRAMNRRVEFKVKRSTGEETL
jgi:outer membrane protein OmpA-like peptidoglycan-associated protein